MKTRLTELLWIETPIICGGMMRVGTAELAAEIEKSGGDFGDVPAWCPGKCRMWPGRRVISILE